MAENRRKKGDIVPIGSVLGRVLSGCRSEADGEMLDVWRLWNRAVGELIAQNTRPAAFKGRLLLVNVSSSTWVHQLHFLKPDLIAKLNEAAGRDLVGDIKFKVGPVKSPRAI